MGVTGLWTVVQPCARPIKLESLNKKRLAVDASIWVYQFLKAVRDKEGNALRNSHVVGFFRRICKLLYFGIKPVFVFDGGAPVLKRQTIAGRKKRREGRREDAARTAGKLLAVQLQRSAEEEAESRRRKKNGAQKDKEDIGSAPVYADETLMTEQEKQRSRKFKKKDAYHLPSLDVSLEDMGAPNDPRIMSQAELEEYARHFHQGQDINLYDFSKIDFDGPFFLSLPPTDRYNILNAARLRSRLRMGYSKEQLDSMFPNRMAFSKFQIERVTERNDLTQRLMNLNGMNGEEAFYKSGQRIAGERGREYVLVKDNQHEGGWVLGVVGNKNEGYEDKPIDVDRYGVYDAMSPSDDVSDEDEFEDVPIEGLNRLPKLPFLQQGVFDQSLHQQENADLQRAIQNSQAVDVEDDQLFVQGDEDLFEDLEEDELQQAITMSLQPQENQDDGMPEILMNRSEPLVTIEPVAEPVLSDSDDDGMDFAAAVAQAKVAPKPQMLNPFDGPLPFESIKLTKSSKEVDMSPKLDDDSGGFFKVSSAPLKVADPIPPWFVAERTNEGFIVDSEPADPAENIDDGIFTFDHRSPDIIDVDELSDTKEIIDLDESHEKVKEDTEAESHLEQDDEKLGNYYSVPVSLGEAQNHQDIVQPPDQPQETPGSGNGEELDTNGKLASIEPSPEPEFEDVLPLDQTPQLTVTMELRPPPSLDEQPILYGDMKDEDEFSDPEDEELLRQLAEEGEEHARFAQTLNPSVSTQKASDYEQELTQLRNQQKKDRRDADEVTQIMITECQQLLTLFGLPYITAPMEAEAQCAELVSLGLVDGIVTDDSDTFLFGGTRVYKNMFNQSKYVECYLTSDFEKEFALHRNKLISFAHLLGSDYTEGIPGVGPVTALEIVTEFTSLEEFRDWLPQVQMGSNNPDDAHAAFRKKFRKKASKILLPVSFPDARVDTAYLEPEVDSDPSQFQWGVVDLNGLRGFLMSTIGWSQERTDEVLVPVIRDMNRRDKEGTQSNITQFMQGPTGAGAFAPRVHRNGPSRMEKAFSRLRQEAKGSDSLSNEEAVHDSSKSAKRSVSNKTNKEGAAKKRKTRASRADSQT